LSKGDTSKERVPLVKIDHDSLVSQLYTQVYGNLEQQDSPDQAQAALEGEDAAKTGDDGWEFEELNLDAEEDQDHYHETIYSINALLGARTPKDEEDDHERESTSAGSHNEETIEKLIWSIQDSVERSEQLRGEQTSLGLGYSQMLDSQYFKRSQTLLQGGFNQSLSFTKMTGGRLGSGFSHVLNKAVTKVSSKQQ